MKIIIYKDVMNLLGVSDRKAKEMIRTAKDAKRISKRKLTLTEFISYYDLPTVEGRTAKMELARMVAK